MSLVEARERRARLMNPPNAVKDEGIDLKRPKPVPVQIQNTKQAEPAQPAPMPVSFAMPYKIGSSRPEYVLSYGEPKTTNGAIREIQKAVCALKGITLGDMLSSCRTTQLVLPRHMAIWLSKTVIKRSFSEIGRRFGLDHSSAMHAFGRIEKLRGIDPVLAQDLEDLQLSLSVALRLNNQDATCSSPPITAT